MTISGFGICHDSDSMVLTPPHNGPLTPTTQPQLKQVTPPSRWPLLVCRWLWKRDKCPKSQPWKKKELAWPPVPRH